MPNLAKQANLTRAREPTHLGGNMTIQWIIFDLCDVLFYIDHPTSSFRPIEANSRILKRIPKHIQLMTLTDLWPDTLEELVKQHPFMSRFDHTKTTHDYGLVKSNPELFRQLAMTFHFQPKDALFIDDKPLHTEAACRAGFQNITLITPDMLLETLSQYIELSA